MEVRFLKLISFGLLLLIFIQSTSHVYSQKIENSKDELINRYIHISHTRGYLSGEIIDTIASQIDYSLFDLTLLGGDLATDYTQFPQSIGIVDSIFDLSSDHTLLSLGNHEYSGLDLVLQSTNRPKYYVYWKDNITFLVIDTQDSLSNLTGDQLQLIQAVCDTIQFSKYLMLLHHKLIWMVGNPDLESSINSTANGEFGDCFYCTNPNNFYSDVYPLLLNVRERNIGIICLAGDIGTKVKQFQYMTPDSIFFIASGIEAGDPDNEVLMMENNLASGKLSWEFISLQSLLSCHEPLKTTGSFRIYPTLVNEEIYIYIGESDNSYNVKLFDVSGNPVFVLNKLRHGVNHYKRLNLRPGFYIYSISDNEQILKATGKIIVN
jgi:hypothetical protein